MDGKTSSELARIEKYWEESDNDDVNETDINSEEGGEESD
jgi:hypothetical protein